MLEGVGWASKSDDLRAERCVVKDSLFLMRRESGGFRVGRCVVLIVVVDKERRMLPATSSCSVSVCTVVLELVGRPAS